MPRNIAETFSSGVWQYLLNLRSLPDLVISHLRLYSVVLCLFVSFCYRAALPVAAEHFASVSFF
jgi:hypothetical protein